jgi:hypothetical protein
MRVFEMDPDVDYAGLRQGGTQAGAHDEYVQKLIEESNPRGAELTDVTEFSPNDDTPFLADGGTGQHLPFSSTRVQDADDDANDHASQASFTPSQVEKLRWLEEQTQLVADMVQKQQQLLSNRIQEEEQEKEDRIQRRRRNDEEERRCAAERQALREQAAQELQGAALRSQQVGSLQKRLESQNNELDQLRKQFSATERIREKKWQEKEREQSARWAKVQKEQEEARAHLDHSRQEVGADTDRKQAWITAEVDRLAELQLQQRQAEEEFQQRRKALEEAERAAEEQRQRIEEDIRQRQKAVDEAEYAVAERQRRAAQQAEAQRLIVLQERQGAATQTAALSAHHSITKEGASGGDSVKEGEGGGGERALQETIEQTPRQQTKSTSRWGKPPPVKPIA